MRLLFTCDEYPPVPHGGIGTFTKTLAEQMAARGHDVFVVGQDHLTDAPSEANINGVTVLRHPAARSGRGRIEKAAEFVGRRLRFAAIVDKLCRSIRPDVVEAYDWSGLVLRHPPVGHLVVRMHGAHTVYERWMNGRAGGGRMIAWAEKRTLNAADALVAVSRMIAERTAREFELKDKPIEIIYNPGDCETFAPPHQKDTRDRNRLLFVGRWHHHKGVDLLMNAMNTVFAKNSAATLELVGPCDSRYARNIISSIPERFRSRVKVVGRIPNHTLPSVYGSATACILPSRVEAFPIVPIESMACGTPVIMSGLVAADEIIDDRVNGFIVDPRDRSQLAQKILFTLEHPQAVDAMRVPARQKILEELSHPVIAAKNEALYKSMVV